MADPRIGSAASGLRVIAAWQARLADEALIEGVKGVYAILAGRSERARPASVLAGAERRVERARVP